MKNRRIGLGLCLVVLILVLSGCQAALTPGFETDLTLSLGTHNRVNGVTALRGAVENPVSVPVTIADIYGREISGEYDIAFTLDTDGDLTTEGDNLKLGTARVVAGSLQYASVTIPAGTAAAIYNLYAVLHADNEDDRLDNNTVSIRLDIGTATNPNLRIYFHSDQQQVALPGGTLPVSFQIFNEGYVPVKSGTTFKVAASFNLNGTDSIIGSTTITLEEALQPLASRPGNFIATMPSLAALAADVGVSVDDFGVWNENLTLMVDADDAVTESDETDNTSTQPVKTGSKKPDLSIQSIRIPEDYVLTGSTATVMVKLENSGNALATGYRLHVYLDSDGSGDFTAGTDVTIGEIGPADSTTVPAEFQPLSGIDANHIDYRFSSATYPTTLTAGEYSIIAEITGDISEYNTANNSSSYTINLLHKKVDLQMVSLTGAAADVIATSLGGAITARYEILNNGESSVDQDFAINFYASSDNDTSTPADDVSLGSITITEDIPAQNTISGTTELDFPSGEAAGFYSVYWVLDSGNTVHEFGESGESNNTITRASGNTGLFFPVNDGSTTIGATAVLYTPRESYFDIPDGRLYVTMITRGYYNSSYYSSSGYGSTYYWESGYRIISTENSYTTYLVPGRTNELAPYSGDSFDYCIRYLPTYISSLPDWALPASLGGGSSPVEEASELTNDDTAVELTGSETPYVDWVVGFISGVGSFLEYDRYTFTFPE